jgi:hypothetical protein
MPPSGRQDQRLLQPGCLAALDDLPGCSACGPAGSAPIGPGAGFARAKIWQAVQQRWPAAGVHSHVIFQPGPRYAANLVVPLRRPTAHTRALVAAAVAGLRQIYRPGFDLAKADVMLMDLSPGSREQGELDLEDDADEPRDAQLMEALDRLSGRYGKGTVHPASAGTRHQAALRLADGAGTQDAELRDSLGRGAHRASLSRRAAQLQAAPICAGV